MTIKRWKQIQSIMENGDPIKDIGCDEQELYEYCVELSAKLKKFNDMEFELAMLKRELGI